MCYGFVPVENPTSFVLKSPQKILHKIRPKKLNPPEYFGKNNSTVCRFSQGACSSDRPERFPNERSARHDNFLKWYVSGTLMLIHV